MLCVAAVTLLAACSDDDDTPETKPEVIDESLFKGSDISSVAGMSSDLETKVSSVEIYKNGEWKLYAMNNSKAPDFEKPALTGYYAGSYTLSGNTYMQYCLEHDGSRTVIAPRKLPMEGQSNFRDLGGYKTAEGKFIKWGLIFRSGNVGSLTDSDLEYLSTIPLKTIIDFRSESEVASAPDLIPTSVIKHLSYPIAPGNMSEEEIFGLMLSGNIDGTKQYMIDINELLVLEYQDTYRAYFNELMNEDNLPIMFHCTAGKDRAGFAAAMFLSALGVDRETIMEDYLLTNAMKGVSVEKCIAEMSALLGEELGKIAGQAYYYMDSVQEEYINKAFETIEAEYGDVESYIVNQLGVDTDKLKQIFLY